MAIDTSIGSPVCLTLPIDDHCSLTYAPKPSLESHELDPECGMKVQIYEPGSYDATLKCGEFEKTYAIQVSEPPQLAESLQYKMPPLIQLNPNWVVWSAQLLAVLICLALVGFLMRFLWRRYLRPTKEVAGPPISKWEPDLYHHRLSEIDEGLSENRLKIKNASFLLTRLLFDIWKSVPNQKWQRKFRQSYLESCQELIRIKFDPDCQAQTQDVSRLIIRYGQDLRRMMDEERSVIS